MPDKKLIVIGGGPNLKNYKELANENIIVMGYQLQSTEREDATCQSFYFCGG